MRNLLFILLTLLSGQLSAQRSIDYTDRRFIYRISVDSFENNECSISSITIIQKSDKRIIQTIEAPDNSFLCDVGTFQLLDVNFDHLNDFRIDQPLPRLVNVCFYYWTYNPIKNRFYRDTLIEEICPTDFDYKKRVIKSHWRAFCCDEGTRTYKLIAGRPVEIENVESVVDERDDTRYIVTKRKLIKGKLKVVSRKFERR